MCVLLARCFSKMEEYVELTLINGVAPLFYVTRFIVILQHFQVLFLGGIGDQLLLPLSCSQFDLQEA